MTRIGEMRFRFSWRRRLAGGFLPAAQGKTADGTPAPQHANVPGEK
jgi:hypothetical protein